MRVYVDSSALLKRVFAEDESGPLRASLVRYAEDRAALVSSSLAWVEVSRAVRVFAQDTTAVDVEDLVEAALTGIHERPISTEVVALARRLHPQVLRSLDAMHLASALLLDVDLLLTYDQRLTDAAREHGIKTAAPR